MKGEFDEKDKRKLSVKSFEPRHEKNHILVSDQV